ncbi:sugar ABC transporter substrate-binding protein [Clostridiaceae bacterium AF29-16BH]|jgi:ribose transport system substrate-binding protein|nr:sugar ABC transporter substrate-binding protein [Clostridiaceae bacterium AF29-16BH]
MKKRLLATMSVVMVGSMLLAGCGKTEDAATTKPAAEETTEDAAADTATDTAASGETIKIGVSVADQSNPFYIDIVDGMESAAKDGDELVIVDAGFDAAKQLNDIDDMIQQGVKVMLIDPVDSNAIKSAVEACDAAGIPVIAYNSPLNFEIASTVATDNYLAGQLVGEAMGKALDGKGEVAMLTYNVAEVCLDRANGFKDAIAEYPDIKIVEEQEIQPGTDTALPVAENILQAYPDLAGMFALNDPSALGCVAAVESANLLDQVQIVGVDGSDDAKAAIAEGKMLASAAQDPVQIGSVAIETAYKVIAGEEVEKDIKIPSYLVDASNAK